MTGVCLRLLGVPEIINTENGRQIKLSYAKLPILLAYLALEHKAHTRESLADLFWPDLQSDDARANLRRALSNLRRAFSDAEIDRTVIHSDRNVVALSRDNFWIDALEVQKEMNHDDIRILYEKIALYKGNFLDGISTNEEDLASWIVNMRTHYELQQISLLERAITAAVDARDFDMLEHDCRDLIKLDCVNERAYSSLIMMHIEYGNKVAARKIYNQYQHTLKEQLGLTPAPYLVAAVENNLPEVKFRTLPIKRRVKESPNLISVPLPKIERRLVSVLYCEISSLNEMKGEEWLQLSANLMPQLHTLALEFKGHFRQLSSSVIALYFGYPTISEFSAKWALDVGLAYQQLISKKVKGVSIRSGAHAGVMLTGTGYSSPDVNGECSKIARDLMETATPDILLATEAALYGFESYFEVKKIKNSTENACAVFEVNAKSESFRKMSNRYSSSFVGRVEQLQVLDTAASVAVDVGGQALLLSGNIGVGKSRLLSEFSSKSKIFHQSQLTGYCEPEYRSRPLHPIVKLIKTLPIFSNDAKEEIEDNLRERLRQDGLADESSMKMLDELLSLQEPAVSKLAKSQCERLFALIIDVLRFPQNDATLLLILENIQWADWLSLQFIEWLRPKVQHYHIFLIISSRERFQTFAPHDISEYFLHLTPFEPLDAVRLAMQYSKFSEMTQLSRDQVLDRTNGVPLFIEEILSLKNIPPNNLEDEKFPLTLRNLIMEQVDNLGDAGPVLCHASCIGHFFSSKLLANIESIPHYKCCQFISQMVAAELVDQCLEPGLFQFRFSFTREVANLTLTNDVRRKIGEKIRYFSEMDGNPPVFKQN